MRQILFLMWSTAIIAFALYFMWVDKIAAAVLKIH